MSRSFLLTAGSLLASAAAVQTHYYVDDSDGAGPEFQGIGAISGGGATSVLLPAYPAKQKDEILQLLFGQDAAALHVLKVEIGSSAQSTDGAEPTHAETPNDLDFKRGYEWSLMQEAKQINPAIKYYGLPWGFPAWVSCDPKAFPALANCTDSPYSYPQTTAGYITSWLEGARNEYGFEVEHVGIWNERGSNNDYIVTLRKALDTAGFEGTGIVAADGDWSIATDCLSNSTVCDSLSALGVHYPGTFASSDALKLAAAGKTLLASEDDSTLNNNIGSACWARVLNRNFVEGAMTGTIAWNLLAAYAKGTQWYRTSLVNALQPWGGNYWASPKVAVTAHTTQFSTPGYRYLKNSTAAFGLQGTGSGKLRYGGSYVTLQSPTDPNTWALVIEKVSAEHSPCVRPGLAPYETDTETATFQLGGNLLAASPKEVFVWLTQLSFGPDDPEQQEFAFLGSIPVSASGAFSLNITVDSIVTVSPQNVGKRGWTPNDPSVPPPKQFPTAYTDTFDSCAISSEAAFFSDQNGAFGCEADPSNSTNIIMRQKTVLRPITWSGDLRPHSLIGSRDQVDVSLSISVAFSSLSEGAIIGARGSGTDDTLGFLLAVDAAGHYNVTTSMLALDLKGLVAPLIQGTLPLPSLPIPPNEWHRFRLDVNGSFASAWVDSIPIFNGLNFTNSSGANGVPRSGFGGVIGTVRYGQFVAFDNLELYSTYASCPVGEGKKKIEAGLAVTLVSCWTEVGYLKGSGWSFNPSSPGSTNGTFSLREDPSLCVTIVPQKEAPGQTLPWPVIVSPCTSPPSPYQLFSQDYVQLYETTISNPYSGRCLDIYQQQADVGTPIDAWPCNPTQQWYYDFHEYGQIIDVNNVVCLGLC